MNTSAFALTVATTLGLAPIAGAHHHGTHPGGSGQPTSPGDVQITISDGVRRIDSDGMPAHPIGRFPNRGNPNVARPQRFSFRMPADPEPAEQPIPAGNGPFGVAVNGVVFEPGTAETWRNDPDSGWRFEALTGSIELGMDDHHAHVQPTGTYHYHGLPTGLIAALGGDDDRMLLIGYAADGFPIYTSRGYADPKDPESGMVTLRSGYRLKPGSRPDGPGGTYDGTFTQDFVFEADSGDLDECNGRLGVTPEYPEGTYYYAITGEFPFISRLFRGTPDPSFARRGPGGPPPEGGPPGRRRDPLDHSPSALLANPAVAEDLGLTAGRRPADLTPDQRERLEQIRLRAAGPERFSMPEVRSALGLSDEQAGRIGEILDGPWADGVEPSSRPEVPTLPEYNAWYLELDRRIERRIEDVLTPDQRDRLTDLLGAPIELRRGPPGPFGPPGRPRPRP